MTGITRFDAILFDLDGTLVDTAPDMVRALFEVQATEGGQPVDYELARSHVSHGAAGLIGLAFPDSDDKTLERLRLKFLDVYEASVCMHSTLFPDMEGLLDRLDDAGFAWGVITNKPERMTEPLMAALDMDTRAACMISGDTLPLRKPDPAPLLLASEKTGTPPDRCVYIGDAARDIQAGLAAGMLTVAAGYGYVTPDDDPASWNAHELVATTEELTHLILKGVNLTS